MKKKTSSQPECQLVGVRSIGLLAFIRFVFTNQTKDKAQNNSSVALRQREQHERKLLSHYLDQTAIHFQQAFFLLWLCFVWAILLIKIRSRIIRLAVRRLVASRLKLGCDTSCEDIISANVPRQRPRSDVTPDASASEVTARRGSLDESVSFF